MTFKGTEALIEVEKYSYTCKKLFAMVPDSSINSWESWFIFNLQKINTNQYYESDSLNVGNCSILREYMTLQDVKLIIITIHTCT